MVAAGRCWCLSVTNSPVTVHLAQASSLDVLVLVGEVGLQAGMHTNCILLYEDVWHAWSPELSSLFGMWRTACSRSFHWCADRRRRLQDAGVSGESGRAVRLLLGFAESRERGSCITACLHLNPAWP